MPSHISGILTPLLTERERNAWGKFPTAKAPETAMGFLRRANQFCISFPPCQGQALAGGCLLPSGSASQKQPLRGICRQQGFKNPFPACGHHGQKFPAQHPFLSTRRRTCHAALPAGSSAPSWQAHYKVRSTGMPGC